MGVHVGGIAVGAFEDGAEQRAAGEAGGVPPGEGGIVGKGDERAAHTLRAHAYGFKDLRADRGRKEGDERRGQ